MSFYHFSISSYSPCKQYNITKNTNNNNNQEQLNKKWIIKYVNTEIVTEFNNNSNNSNNNNITNENFSIEENNLGKIIVQGRTITPTEILPKRFYTPLKYELKHVLPLNCIQLPASYSSSQVKIRTSIKLVDSVSGQEITDSPFSQDGKGIKGTLDEFLIKRFDSKIYSIATQFQLTDITYRHDRYHKKPFAFHVSYFLCDEQGNILDTLLIKQSPSFQSLSKKRKRYIEEEKRQQEQEQEQQKQKDSLFYSLVSPEKTNIISPVNNDDQSQEKETEEEEEEAKEESSPAVKRYKAASQQQGLICTMMNFV